MKKLFKIIIPVFLLALLAIYSSCNDVPVQTSTNGGNESTPIDPSGNNNTLNKDASTTKNEVNVNQNSESGLDAKSGQTDASDICTYVTIDSSKTVYIPTGTNYTYTYYTHASINAQTSERHHIIYKDGTPVLNVDNWYTGFCGPGPSPVKNDATRTMILEPGVHSIQAKVQYKVGNTYYDMWATATVDVRTMNLPSVPNTSFGTDGLPPVRRPKITWTASSPNVTGYVVQRRLYPNGQFADFANVPASTLFFIDNSITVVTDRYDLVYYNVEYRVRAVNPVGSSGYQAPSYSWYSHGCYSHSLGYTCAME